MYLLIRYPAGVIVEGLMLSQQGSCMRVAAAGFPDTVELTYSGSQWLTASSQPVEFDFLMPTANMAESVPV